MNLDVGTVFRWKDFPEPRIGQIKARWFVYLGDSGYFSQVIVAYICTTTSQTHHFESGGDREAHDYFLFKKSPLSPFEDDCALDFDERPHAVKKARFENNPNIELKGMLDENTLRIIYNRILRSRAYSKSILRDIHESFNKSGITGLTRPK